MARLFPLLVAVNAGVFGQCVADATEGLQDAFTGILIDSAEEDEALSSMQTGLEKDVSTLVSFAIGVLLSDVVMRLANKKIACGHRTESHEDTTGFVDFDKSALIELLLL
eukprot:TRINITY_DN47148_c0_g1_i1.p2 TRINITY_DN47148_c0_g1~~TRINITY_DN47148_c0_g1_i1.p2  ORF type:complete len:110 (+),score=23.40 TRINITY_DN47148_c0_g1_i1:122-451(+)